MKLKGTILRFDKPNINGFMYSKKCGQKMIEQLQESIKNDVMFGELRDDNSYELETSLENVAFKCTKLHLSNKEISGEFETLDTPMGHRLEEIMKGSMSGEFRFAPRALANLGDDGNIYPDTYTVIAVDVINCPETKDDFNIEVIE